MRFPQCVGHLATGQVKSTKPCLNHLASLVLHLFNLRRLATWTVDWGIRGNMLYGKVTVSTAANYLDLHSLWIHLQ